MVIPSSSALNQTDTWEYIQPEVAGALEEESIKENISISTGAPELSDIQPSIGNLLQFYPFDLIAPCLH